MEAGRSAPVTPPRAAGRGEHWWPVALAIVVTAVLHVALPAKYRVNPPWVAPAVALALLAALIIGDPGRIDRQKAWLRIVTGAVIAFLTVANLLAAIHLFHDILTNNKLFAGNATGLLATGGVIWAINVIAFGCGTGTSIGVAPPPARTIRMRIRHFSSRRCCTPPTRQPPGCRSSPTTCRWLSGPPPHSAPPTRAGHNGVAQIGLNSRAAAPSCPGVRVLVGLTQAGCLPGRRFGPPAG